MNIKLYEKPIITKFVTINDEEFELKDLYGALYQIQQTKEDDHYGDYSLRDYNLDSKETMDKLVKIGLVKNYTGPRMANLYCMKDENSINDLLNTLYKLDI